MKILMGIYTLYKVEERKVKKDKSSGNYICMKVTNERNYVVVGGWRREGY